MRTPGTNVRDVSEVRDHDSGLAERADDQRTVELTAVFQKSVNKKSTSLRLHVDADHPTAIIFIKLSVKVFVNKLLKGAL